MLRCVVPRDAFANEWSIREVVWAGLSFTQLPVTVGISCLEGLNLATLVPLMLPMLQVVAIAILRSQ